MNFSKLIVVICVILMQITNSIFAQSQCNSNVSICTPGVAGPFPFIQTATGPPVDYADPTGCSTGSFGNATDFGFIILNITTSGPLNLLVNGNANTGFIDVIVYNIPNGVSPCVAVQNENNEIGCNYAPASVGCTQFGNDFACGSSLPAPMVSAGDQLMIIVHDYSTSSNNFTLQLGGSGAQTGPYNGTVNAAGPYTVNDPPVVMTAVDGGGTWTASCGSCINATTGQFNPATAGPGNHTVCYSIGQPPCQGSGCEVITVTGVCTMTAAASRTNVTCNGAANGTANVTTANGTAGYTYAWSNGGTGSSISGLGPGTYTVTVTDALGCTATASTTVTQPTVLAMNLNPTAATCAGNNGSITGAASGGTAPYTYSWSHNAGLNSPNATGLSPGSYTVTVTDARGCTRTATATITQNGTVTSTFTYNGNQCLTGNSFTFTNTGTTGVTNSWDFGNGSTSSSNNATHAYAAAGNYTVTHTITNGACTSTSTQAISVYPMPTSSIAGIAPDCQGTSTGDVNLTPANGTPAYAYSWSNGAITQNLTNVPAGTYNVTISDNNGCQTTNTVTLTDPPVLTVATSFTDASCEGVCNGDATATPAGGVGPFTYSWSGGQTTAQATGLCDGNYTVTVTDNNGCQATANVVISNATVFNSSIATSDASCGLSNGDATATPIGGTGPFTYSWAPSVQTGVTITGIPAGNYDVTITDNNGCMSTSTGVVANTAGPTATVTASTDVSCNGGADGDATVTAGSGTGPYTYSWSPTGGTGVTASGLSAGTLYTVTVTDANTCVATATITLNEPTAINLVTSSNPSNCSQSDGEVDVVASGGTGAYSYSWDDGSGVVGTVANLIGVPAGNYTLTVTDANSCVGTQSQVVTDLTGGTISTTQNNISCNAACDGNATASVVGATLPVSYVWNNAAATTGATLSSLCVGNYTVTATDGVGCVLTASVLITEPDVLLASIINPLDVTCNGDTDGSAEASVIGGTAPYSYLWNDGAAQTTAIATNLAPGGYSVTVTDDNGCQSTVSVTIAEPTPIQLDGGEFAAHCGLADGDAYVEVVNGGVAPFSYSWNNSPSVTDTAFNVVPGLITATVVDVNGCTESYNITVGDIPAGIAVISGTVNPLCAGDCNGSATVSMSGSGTTPYTYSWNDPSNQTTSTATGLCAGTYDVTITDANGCVTVIDATLNEPVVLSVFLTPTNPSCYEACDGELFANAAGGVTPYSYQWDDLLGQTGHVAMGLCGDGTVYNVVVTDANGCILNKGGSLFDPTELVMDSVVVDASCGQSDGEACVSLSGGTGPYTTSWQYNGSTALCEVGIPSNTYVVNGTDNNGCTAQISVTVSDLSGPTAAILSQTDVTCFDGNDGSATSQITGGLMPYAYQWDANAANQTTPTASNLMAGTYTLTITDDNGCIASTSVTISEPDSIEIYGAVTDPNCYDYADGQIVATAIGGTGPYTFSWDDNNAQQTATATGLPEGQFTVVLTDDNGCTNYDQFELYEPSQLSGIINILDVNCNAACDGSAAVTPVNGVGVITYLWDDANLQTTSVASNLCAGNYTVILTDGTGCKDTIPTVIAEPTVLAALIDQSGNTSCNGVCDGFANITPSGGVAPYTFLWSNGATTQTAINLCSGNYTCVVTDGNGCSVTRNIQITEPVNLTGVMTSINATCYGLNNGSATYTVSGGTAPYTYQWDDAAFQTSVQAASIVAGAYTVNVEDANGCTLIGVVNITQPTQMVANVNIVPTNCNQSNGQACVSISGGITPYQYSWNDPNSQQAACAMGIQAGTYTVLITDGNNCTLDSIINVNNLVGPTVTFDNLTDPSCFGLTDGEVNMTVSGGVTPYNTYQWIDAVGNAVGNPNDPQLQNVPDGCYTLEVEDGGGCYVANTQCVTQPNVLNSAVTASQDVTCYLACNGTATLSTSGGVLPHNIVWNIGATTSNISNLCAGTYQATTTDNNGCTSVSAITIVEPAQLVTSIVSEIGTSCNGTCDGSIEVNVVGGIAPYLNTWTPNVSSSTLAVNLCVGGYTVTTTDVNGCSANISGNVTSPTPLTGSQTVVNATCGFCNGTVSFNMSGGTPPYSYLWDDGQTTQTATNVCAGVFGGTVTDANGCTYTLVSNVLNIAGPVINTVGFSSPTCNGLSNGSATPDFGGGTAPFSFQWTNGQNVQSAVAITAGNHCVTITDGNGCQATSCVNIPQPNELLAIPDGGTTICYGAETQIWASGSGGTIPYTIIWNGTNTTGFTGSGPIMVDPLVNQDYCFRVEDSKGCSSPTVCVEVDVTPALNVQLPADVFICDGESFTIDASYSGGNGDPYTYNWYIGTYPSAVIATTEDYTIQANGLATYIVEVNDGCSDADFDTIVVDINPTPIGFLNVLNPAECAPGEINFSVNSDIGVDYIWDYQCDGIVDYTTTGTTATNTYANAGVYDVCVDVVSPAGCVTTVSEVGAVEIYENPIADFIADPSTTTITNPTVSFTDLSSNAYYWYWDFDGDNVFDDSVQNPSYFYEFAGVYDVELIAVNVYGCSDTIIVPYTVLPDQSIFVPNAFSPDGDGTNDFFFVNGIGLDVKDFDIYVFNRWGQIIWEGHSPDDQWDGTYLNVDVQTDVYVWKLSTKDIHGNGVELNGHVTVIR